MKTSKELLTLVAKVAHVDILAWNDGTEPYSSGEGYILANNKIWNPIVNDGDAFRLAVKLMMYVNIDGMEIGYRDNHVLHTMHINIEDGDVRGSIRKTIVRAAVALYELQEA